MTGEEKKITGKQIVACILIACVITAALAVSFLWIKSGSRKDNTTAATPATTVVKAPGDFDEEDNSGSVTATVTEVNSKGDGSYDNDNEVAEFSVPTDKKESFATDQKYRFDAQAGQFGVTVNRIQTREHNWESYPYGPENKFVKGSTSSAWVSIIKLREEATGMTDAAAFPIRATDPEEAYEEVITEKARCIAWVVGVADFMSNWLYADGTKFSETNPELVDFVKENDEAQARAREKQQLTAQLDRLRYKSDADDQKQAVQQQIAELDELGCGVGRWLDATDDPYTAELNDEFIAYLAIVINIMDEFHIVGIQNVYSEVNYHQTIIGDVDQIKLVENKSYQEINQPALVLAILDKNGKVSMKWGLDMRDGRPLKVLEWSKNPTNPKNQKKTSTNRTTTTTTTETTKQPPNENGGGGRSGGGGSSSSTSTNTTTTTTTIIKNPDGGGGGGGGKTDGNGAKVQSEGSAFQNNAPRNSGTELASDGDGQKTAEPVQPSSSPAVADTVVEGSSDSGRRSIAEQNSVNTGGAVTTAPSQGPATNGSTESSDTSSGPASGSTDSSGATVDNSATSSNTTVSQASAESATPTSEAQAGYTPPED